MSCIFEHNKFLTTNIIIQQSFNAVSTMYAANTVTVVIFHSMF